MAVGCIIFEDEHLLAVHKPAGINTHKADEDAPWGMIDLILAERTDLSNLGIHQRLDRETSGVLLFAKSPTANQSLSAQFEQRRVRKTYLLATRSTHAKDSFTASEPIEGKPAKTAFRKVRQLKNNLTLWEAFPETGRTHQIRIHARSHGIPIEGDSAQVIQPLLLHASKLEIEHPQTRKSLVLEAPMPPSFDISDLMERRFVTAETLRNSLLPGQTNIYRLIHREADGFPGITLDYLDGWLYLENFGASEKEVEKVAQFLIKNKNPKGIILSQAVQGERREDKQIIFGEPPSSDHSFIENGVGYCLKPLLQGGIGLFLDQRENRKRIQTMAKGKRILNLFAYTCGFSVAAAAGGASETVSVDLSKPILDWGRENFILNKLDLEKHRFFAREAGETLRKMAKKELFDIIVIDPPSFAHKKSGGTFSAKRDFKKLVEMAACVTAKAGWILCSSNLAEWKASDFLSKLREGIKTSGRKIVRQIWVPQPFDFPSNSLHPPYFKSVWFQLE